MQYRAAAYWNILGQIAHSIATAKIIDRGSYTVSFLVLFCICLFIYIAYNILFLLYQLLHKIFDEFARLWISKKVNAKSESDSKAQQFKLKPRAFQIESVIEDEIETLGSSCPAKTFSEWKEFSFEENSADNVIFISFGH